MAALPWSDVAVVPQALGLLEELTIAENVRLPARLAGPNADPEAADELTRQLGIDHLADRYPNEVSLGEQQRTAVARALVLRPRVLLADEPVAHQNDEFVQVILDRFDALAASGGACLVATHNLGVLARMTKVVELHGGRLSEPTDPPPGDADDSVWRPPT